MAPLGALLASLGASWAALGASGGLLEALLAALRALLWPLGSSWVLLDRSWGPFWLPGGLFLELFGSLFVAPLQNHENIKKLCFFVVF